MKPNLLPIVMCYAALIVAIGVAIAGNPRLGAENPEPGPTEARMKAQQLQSVTNTVHPIPPRSERTNVPPILVGSTNAQRPLPVPAPKLTAIVLRDVWAVQFVSNAPALLVVPERYLHDLTNVFRHQWVGVLRLEEP